ncbi:MAG: hypothetical protein ACM3IJ_02660 [Candidatus Levyibacteriota bacterium]
MIKTLIMAAIVFVFSFFMTSVVVYGQTYTPTATPTSTMMPTNTPTATGTPSGTTTPNAPRTGF